MGSIASLASRKEREGGQQGQTVSMVVPGLRRNPAQRPQKAGSARVSPSSSAIIAVRLRLEQTQVRTLSVVRYAAVFPRFVPVDYGIEIARWSVSSEKERTPNLPAQPRLPRLGFLRPQRTRNRHPAQAASSARRASSIRRALL